MRKAATDALEMSVAGLFVEPADDGGQLHRTPALRTTRRLSIMRLARLWRFGMWIGHSVALLWSFEIATLCGHVSSVRDLRPIRAHIPNTKFKPRSLCAWRHPRPGPAPQSEPPRVLPRLRLMCEAILRYRHRRKFDLLMPIHRMFTWSYGDAVRRLLARSRSLKRRALSPSCAARASARRLKSAGARVAALMPKPSHKQSRRRSDCALMVCPIARLRPSTPSKATSQVAERRTSRPQSRRRCRLRYRRRC
jgi:hypothetical protein